MKTINFFYKVLAILFLSGNVFFSQNIQVQSSDEFVKKIPGTKSYCEPYCDSSPNSSSGSGKGGSASTFNGDGTIATSYTVTACGLDYTYHSASLHKRSFFSVGTSPNNQPYTFPISGIPANACIVKALVYANFERASSLTAVNITLTNPLNVVNNFAMTLIGTHQSSCWGGGPSGNKVFRADVTAAVTGNGNYVINGLPVSPTGIDCNGFTMLVIWSDPTQNWTGSMVIADGNQVQLGGTINKTISGFNVCGPVTFARNFVCVGDFQKIANTPIALNSNVANANLAIATQSVWNYVEANVAAPFAGQTSAQFIVGPNSSDCFQLCVAGMYYRTNCNVCPSTSNLTVNVATTPSCPTSNASVTSVSGGSGPYTYTWLPGNQNTSVITNVPAGNYTVLVSSGTGCLAKTGSAVVSVSTSPVATLNVNTTT